MSKKVFNMAGGKHSAAAYAAFENRLYGGNVKASPDSFVVSAGSGMNASISAGDGLIDTGNNYARRIQTDSAETVAVAAASGSFNRIDSIVAYIDTDVTPTTSVTDNTNDILKFASVAGTAASTPVAPSGAAILSAIGAGKPYMILANVLVPQSAANLSGATFTNMAPIANDPSGWKYINEAWTYSSWSSTTKVGVITVPSGATARYSVGQKVRFIQSTGGTKHGFIVAVTSTTVSIFFGLTTTLANEAIILPHLSTEFMPYGYDGPILTKEAFWSNGTSSERWVYEVSGWGAITGNGTVNCTEVVAFPLTFASIPNVVFTNNGDRADTTEVIGGGGNSIHGQVTGKAFGITTSQFNAYCWTISGGWTSGQRVYYGFMAKGPVA